MEQLGVRTKDFFPLERFQCRNAHFTNPQGRKYWGFNHIVHLASHITVWRKYCVCSNKIGREELGVEDIESECTSVKY